MKSHEPLKLTNKQKAILEILEWFIPDGLKNGEKVSEYNYGFFGAPNLVESNDGIPPEKAYFEKTDKGISPKCVKDIQKLFQLIIAHRRLALHRQMWTEGFAECTLHPSDFIDCPDYIQQIAKESCEAAGRNYDKFLNHHEQT